MEAHLKFLLVAPILVRARLDLGDHDLNWTLTLKLPPRNLDLLRREPGRHRIFGLWRKT